MNMSKMRENFEKHLNSYLEIRIVFETHLNKLQSFVNMLELLESETDKLKPKVKTKIQESLESSLSYGKWTKLWFQSWNSFQLPDLLEYEHQGVLKNIKMQKK